MSQVHLENGCESMYVGACVDIVHGYCRVTSYYTVLSGLYTPGLQPETLTS